jgi:hypothetical protein
MEDGNRSFSFANTLETNYHTNQAECVDSVVGHLPSQSQAVSGVPEVARARALVLLQGVPAQLVLTRTTAEQAADLAPVELVENCHRTTNRQREVGCC